MGIALIVGAIPGFFMAAWFVMIMWGNISPQLGIQTIGYWTSTLVTIAIWLGVAPLLASSFKKAVSKS
jgi:Mg/Co/Ni transporter MgtE